MDAKKSFSMRLGTHNETPLEYRMKQAGSLTIQLEFDKEKTHGPLAAALRKNLNKVVAEAQKVSSEALGTGYCDVFIAGLQALHGAGDYSFKNDCLKEQAQQGIADTDARKRCRWELIKTLLEAKQDVSLN